MKLMHMQKKIV